MVAAVGAHSPGVPDDLEGPRLPCLSDEGASAERSVERLGISKPTLYDWGREAGLLD